MATADAGPGALAEIRTAATRLFYEQGYDATTLRQIAAAAGFKVGSLYYYIAGKEALLLDIMVRVLDDLAEEVRRAVDAPSAWVAPIARLRAAVAAHLRFNAERTHEVFVGNTELRSLSAESRAVVVAKREAHEEFFADLIADVAASGGADVIDLQVHVFALLAQAAHVAGWYRPGGPRAIDDVGRAYSELALRGLAIPPQTI